MAESRRRKNRDQQRYEAADISLLVGEYVPEAIGTLVQLMRNSKRDQVKYRACCRIIELAVGDEEGVGDGEQSDAKIYILATAGEGQPAPDTRALAAELRKRRQVGGGDAA